MTAALSTAPDVRDCAVLEVFDRHLQWEARSCLVCGGPGGPECDRCHNRHDAQMKRLVDQ